MTTAAEILAELDSLGTAQYRKTYGRHGVSEACSGVSWAHIHKIAKRHGTDHELAVALWTTGHYEAQVLATFAADPEQLDARTLDAWAKDLTQYLITDMFARLVAQTPHARSRFEKWRGATGEWVGRAGWLVGAALARESPDLPDAYFEEQLATIEGEIHSRKNRVRDAMNSALVSIGVRNDRLRAKAVAAAKRIGRVEVDHGETGCKTPDAVAYMAKIAEHKAKKSAKKKVAKR